MENKKNNKDVGFSQTIKIKNMPFVSVYIHFVWSTKNRIACLKTKTIREAMWQHIKANANTKDIYTDFVNGYQEHCIV